MANAKEGLGHFLSKSGTGGIVKVCGKAINRGGGLGIEIPYEYIFSGQDKLLERLEKLLVTENHHHLITAVSLIKRLSLYVFALWDQDLASIVRITEGPYYQRFFKENM